MLSFIESKLEKSDYYIGILVIEFLMSHSSVNIRILYPIHNRD